MNFFTSIKLYDLFTKKNAVILIIFYYIIVVDTCNTKLLNRVTMPIKKDDLNLTHNMLSAQYLLIMYKV
jgi:hypothetical protein